MKTHTVALSQHPAYPKKNDMDNMDKSKISFVDENNKWNKYDAYKPINYTAPSVEASRKTKEDFSPKKWAQPNIELITEKIDKEYLRNMWKVDEKVTDKYCKEKHGTLVLNSKFMEKVKSNSLLFDSKRNVISFDSVRKLDMNIPVLLWTQHSYSKDDGVKLLYELKNDDTIYPLNPYGRTGIEGRGLLGNWGANFAADPIITRFQPKSDNKIIEMVVIKRKDTGEFAIPGGMVDPGEKALTAGIREFLEEALDYENTNKSDKEKSKEEFEKIRSKLMKLFDEAPIYKGYVDDPRNTDNSWMETSAFNAHIPNDDELYNIELKAGDDAANVYWKTIGIMKNGLYEYNTELKLYASHEKFVRKTLDKFNKKIARQKISRAINKLNKYYKRYHKVMDKPHKKKAKETKKKYSRVVVK